MRTPGPQAQFALVHSRGCTCKAQLAAVTHTLSTEPAATVLSTGRAANAPTWTHLIRISATLQFRAETNQVYRSLGYQEAPAPDKHMPRPCGQAYRRVKTSQASAVPASARGGHSPHAVSVRNAPTPHKRTKQFTPFISQNPATGSQPS
jgi:hypothetical protein